MKNFIFVLMAMMFLTVNAKLDYLYDNQPKKFPVPAVELGTIRERVMPLLNNESAPVHYELNEVTEAWCLVSGDMFIHG